MFLPKIGKTREPVVASSWRRAAAGAGAGGEEEENGRCLAADAGGGATDAIPAATSRAGKQPRRLQSSFFRVPSRLIFSFSFFSSCRCRCGERRDERGQSGGDGLERVLLRQRAEKRLLFFGRR